MKVIVLTGGGTAGHVVVNMTLIPQLVQEGWRVVYIGSHKGIEKELIEGLEDIVYYPISTGKLRRYVSWENIKDPFKVLKGISETYRLLKKIKPNVVFSGGGFVSVPVVIGAWLRRVPSVIRETDYTCGLANKINSIFAKRVCVTFPDTLKDMPNYKRKYYGPIIRLNLLEGDMCTGLMLTRFEGKKPILLIMGGSQGSQKINEMVRKSLNTLLDKFDIVHICGRHQVDDTRTQEGYKQYEYIGEELGHIYAMADIVVTRAGSNAVFEGIVLKKPMVLIPLSRKASRGEQELNARYASDQGYGKMLLEENLTEDTLVSHIEYVYDRRSEYIRRLNQVDVQDAVSKQIKCIEDCAL